MKWSDCSKLRDGVVDLGRRPPRKVNILRRVRPTN
jgi:hypothetical protein